MSEAVNRQVLLVEKPTGKLAPEHFKMSKGAVPEPKDGEALLRVRYISLDAANRAWMHGATYRAAVEANTVMAGGGRDHDRFAGFRLSDIEQPEIGGEAGDAVDAQ